MARQSLVTSLLVENVRQSTALRATMIAITRKSASVTASPIRVMLRFISVNEVFRWVSHLRYGR
jgi:hypothetical protein